MSQDPLVTANLTLVLKSLEEVRAGLASMSAADRAEVSPIWLAQAEAASSPNPWIHGFRAIHRESGAEVGQCGFKGPPTDEGVVEIAYMTSPEFRGRGYATESAAALATFAFADDRVRVVRAHTAPKPNASARVLMKCGYEKIGTVIDPEDGPVWRWEKGRDASSAAAQRAG